ncbi:hypothetical protein AAHC03_05282 [Spirometra sp. Aus1]
MMPDSNPNWNFDSGEPATKSDPQIDPYVNVVLRDNSSAYLHTIHEELEEEDSEILHYNSFDTTEGSDEKITVRHVSSAVLTSEVENESQKNTTSSSLESNRQGSVSSCGGLTELQIPLESTAGQQMTESDELSDIQSHMGVAAPLMEERLMQETCTDSKNNGVFGHHEIATSCTGNLGEVKCGSGADFITHTTDPAAQGNVVSWCGPGTLEAANMGALSSEVTHLNHTFQDPLNLAVTMAEYICTRSGHLQDSRFNETSFQDNTDNSGTEANTRSFSNRRVTVDDRRNTVQDAFPAIVFDSPYHSELGSTSFLTTGVADQTINTPQSTLYSVSLKAFEILRSHSLDELQGINKSAFMTQEPERFLSATDVSLLTPVSLTDGICAPQLSRHERSISQPPDGRTTALNKIGDQCSSGSRHNTQATSPTETQIHNLNEWLFSPTPSPGVFSEGETSLLPCQYNTPEGITEISAQMTPSGISIAPSEQADITWASAQRLETGGDFDYEDGQSEPSVPLRFRSLHFPLPSDGLTTTLVTNNNGRAEWVFSHSSPCNREMVTAAGELVASAQYDHPSQLGQRSHNLVCFAFLPTHASQMKRSPAVQGVCALLHRQPTEQDRSPTGENPVNTAGVTTRGCRKTQSHTVDNPSGSPLQNESRMGDGDDRISPNSTSTLSSASTISSTGRNSEEPPIKRPSYDYGEEEMGEKEMDWFLLRGAVGADAAQPGFSSLEEKETCNVQAKSLTPKQRLNPKVSSVLWRFHRGLWCRSRKKVSRELNGPEEGQIEEPVLVWRDACEKTVDSRRPDNMSRESCSFSDKLDALPYIDNEESYSENWYITESQQFSWIERAQLATAEEITLYSVKSTDSLTDGSPIQRFKFFRHSAKLCRKGQKQSWLNPKQKKTPHHTGYGRNESPLFQRSWWSRACGICSCLSAQQDNKL